MKFIYIRFEFITYLHYVIMLSHTANLIIEITHLLPVQLQFGVLLWVLWPIWRSLLRIWRVLLLRFSSSFWVKRVPFAALKSPFWFYLWSQPSLFQRFTASTNHFPSSINPFHACERSSLSCSLTETPTRTNLSQREWLLSQTWF